MGAATVPHSTLPVDDYLELDAQAEDGRYEYDDGRVYALAGAQPEHVQVVTNLVTALHSRLRGRGCRVLSTDQRVRVGDRFYYPDVGVVCQSPEYAEDNPLSLCNPQLLIEVTSESTAQRDHETKFDAYTRLDSLQEYWTVSSNHPRLLQYARHDEWVVRIVRDEDGTVQCEAFDVEVAMAEVYDLVEWERDTGDSDAASAGETEGEEADSA